MAKNGKWWLVSLFMLAGSIGVFGIGTLFFSGSFMSAFLLSYIPKIIHTIIGVLLMVSGVGGAITSFARK